MFMDSSIKIKGRCIITTLKRQNGIWVPVSTNVYDNLITTVGKNLLADYIVNGISDYIATLAIGTGTTTVSADDTEVEDEIFRISADNIANVNNATYFYFYVSPEEANMTWGNVGLLTQSGILVSHLNCNETKNNSMAKNVTYTLTFS